MRIGTEGSPTGTPSLTGWPETSVSAERAPAAGTSKPTGSRSQDSVELSPEARQQLEKLKARDQQVRAHEAAHMTAGGSLVRGGASYTYQQGPDGRRYAVGGEVSLDASPVRDDPRATIAKAERIRAAALAPADPSAQDRSVAAQAAAMASQAAAELARRPASSSGRTTGSESGGKLDLTG